MRIKLLFLFFVSIVSLKAQNACSSGRYYSEVFTNVSATTGIKFGASDPYGLVNNQDLYLDVYEPVGDNLQKRPLIVHQFGGGFLIGWRTEPVIPQMAEMYTKRGFVFATIDYRLGFNVADGQSAERAVYRAAQDLRASLRYLVDHADQFGIDTSAIFLTGTSAGCISAFVSTYMNNADRLDIPSTYGIFLEPTDLGCPDCSGNTNFNSQEVKIHGIVNNWGAVLDTSYINILTDPADNVPVISFHGTADAIVPYVEGNAFSLPIFPSLQGSYLIHQRLDHLGVKNKLFPLDGLGHEPQLLQLQTWVTDTIISQGSLFLYEILYGDSIHIIGDQTLCVGNTSTYSLPFHANSSYCWEAIGGNIITSANNQVIVEWPSAGNFQLIGYELDKRQISKKAVLNVAINNPPTPSLSFTSNDGFFDFNAVQANNYQWSFGDESTNIGNPVQHQYTDTGTFVLSLTIYDDYCSNSLDTTIHSDLCPEASFQIVQNDSSFHFVNTSAFSTSALWISSDGSLISSYDLVQAFSNEGNYSISLVASNAYCSDTITQNFSVNFCSQADFTYTLNNLQASFISASYNAFFYSWDFGDGNISALENPVHTYNAGGSYQVKYITSSIEACLDTIEKTLIIDEINGIKNLKELALEIQPNPFTDFVDVKGLNFKLHPSFILYSMKGEEIERGILTSSRINFPLLKVGIYYLKIQEEGASFYQKIVRLE